MAAGSFSQPSSPNWARMAFSAAESRKRWSACSTRQEKRWRRAVKSSSLSKAPSLRMASTGEKRPSSFTICPAQSLPVKAVRWVLPVEMSQKQTPPLLLSR